MKKGGIITTILIVGLLTLSSIQLVKAGSEFQPEFEDTRNDTIRYWDILSAWFTESQDDPDTLRIILRMHGSTPYIQSRIFIKFKCDSIKYYLNASINILGIPTATIAQHTNNEWTTHTVKGNIDFEQNLITFKIPKDQCQKLKTKAMITDAFASTSYIHCHHLNSYLILYSLLHDSVYGKDYQIKY